MFSEYLKSRQELCRKLVDRLSGRFEYVSVLGKRITGKKIDVSTSLIDVDDSFEVQSGFVVRLYNGRTFSEYSFTDIREEDLDRLEQEITESVRFSDHLLDQHADLERITDEPMVKDFERKGLGRRRTVPEAIAELEALRDKVKAVSDKIVFVRMTHEYYDVSVMFLSKNRTLTQFYSWNAVRGYVTAKDGDKMQSSYDVSAYNDVDRTFAVMNEKAEGLGKLAVELLDAENIEPGIYDIITAPSISGLIAHEAFGHGVEMDMFVKQRAKARMYVGKQVASELIEMHDGAAATESCVGYFFDDDGMLAHDTVIIKNGILMQGISDAVSAVQLGAEPTGNGRRSDPYRKSYTRMTNTFFSAGKDKLEDMIASVKHGYMLFQTDNGMEDPKNWSIQCVAQYGREIRDGKFTGKIVAPVVMSGYVPDLLMSISMVSEDFEVIGSGHCGKGYKEYVPVSDGGPYLKARCRLG